MSDKGENEVIKALCGLNYGLRFGPQSWKDPYLRLCLTDHKTREILIGFFREDAVHGSLGMDNDKT